MLPIVLNASNYAFRNTDSDIIHLPRLKPNLEPNLGVYNEPCS